MGPGRKRALFCPLILAGVVAALQAAPQGAACLLAAPMSHGDSFRRSAAQDAGAVAVQDARTAAVETRVAAAPPPLAMTLEEALRLAEGKSPRLAAERAIVARAEGRLHQSRIYPFNPVLGVDAGHRHGPDESWTDSSYSLSQEIEIAGQRGQREGASQAELASAQASLLRQRQLVASGVTNAYSEAVRFRDLLAIQEQDTDLARRFAAYAVKRFESGASSQIERNFAQVALGRAERDLRTTAAAYREAQARLSELIGLGAVRAVEPVGLPPPTDAEPAALDALLKTALESRSDLVALRQASLAAEGRRRLVGREAVPNLTVEGFHEREGDDRISGGGLSVGIPIFNRNQGRIAETAAEVVQAHAEQAAAELAVERELIAAHARLTAAVSSANQLKEQVVGTLDENLGLLERSFDAGKIGATELVLFRRELVQAQRDYVQALVEAWQARTALDLAAGTLRLPRATEE